MSQKLDAFSKSKSDHCTRNCDEFQDTALDGSVMPQSTELTRGPSELVQHFRL